MYLMRVITRLLRGAEYLELNFDYRRPLASPPMTALELAKVENTQIPKQFCNILRNRDNHKKTVLTLLVPTD